MRMNCSNGKSHCLSRCLGIAVLAVVGLAVVGWIVMLLWNWLMPALFTGAQTIGFAQALGVLLLSKILFGGFHGRHRRHCREHHARW